MPTKRVTITKSVRSRPSYTMGSRYRKKRSAYRSLRIPVLFGKSRVCRLRYALEFNRAITSSSGSYQEIAYLANSCYDPYNPAGGHQPRGFDQMMEMFDHFLVLGSRIVIKFIAPASTAPNPMCCSIVLNDDTTALGSHSDVAESRTVKCKYLTDSSRALTIGMNFSAKRFFSVDKKALSAKSAISGSALANPTELAVFHVGAQCIGTNTQQVELAGYIDYVVKFHESKLPTIS
mgnify:CR=1 FL=1